MALQSAFVWILHTANGEVAKVGGEILENREDAISIRIDLPGKPPLMVAIPWHK